MSTVETRRPATRAFELATTADGSIRVRSLLELAAYGRSATEDVQTWAARTPERTFVAERAGDDTWNRLTYGAALARIRTIGGGLLASGASAGAPVAVIADNGIDHALVALASMHVGVPVAPISVGYASPDASQERLRDLLAKLGPAFVFAGSAGVAERVAPFARTVTALAAIEGDAAAADDAAARVTRDTVAKIMFTSGSTGTPKGVITTHGMLVSNQTMLSAVWPELQTEPPVIVDWLPWSHCFGGSHNLGMIMRNGGTLYVDGGRPMPGLFDTTLRNVADCAPNIIFSVPRGFTLLVERLQSDEAFAAGFFSRLRIACSGGAAFPDSLRRTFIELGRRLAPHPVRVTSSWGTTECAPFVTTSWGDPEPDNDTIGTPAPGLAIKLVPNEGRFEICVSGPNITPGYWHDPVATAAAFDAEGYYKTGDAGALKDPEDPSRGILYTGRLVENFKLTSGTWVNVGALRLALLERCAPVVEDLIVCGHDRDTIAVLLFISRVHAGRHAGIPDADHATLATHPAIVRFVETALAEHNAGAAGTSTKILRFSLLPEPPNRAAGEIADKGTINQRRALELRADAVAALYSEPARW